LISSQKLYNIWDKSRWLIFNRWLLLSVTWGKKPRLPGETFRKTSWIKKQLLEKTTQEVREMENYRKTSHSTYDIKYHLVWITKNRKSVLTGKIAERTRELIRQTSAENEVEILSGHVSKDHIHLLVSVPPHLSVSKLVQYLKGYSSRKLQMEYKEINRQFWGKHLWARGYFAASSGNVTDEVIAEYIRTQDVEESKKGDNFGITEL